MKFNKWTVGLAAVGLVSLTYAAKAEEKPNMVETALSSTSLSGYVDTSMQWNANTGNANLPPYRFGGAGKADGFNFNVLQLRLEKPLDETDWAAGYRADLWFGPDAKALGTSSYVSELNLASDLAIRQAYVALRMPVLNGINWKVGVFDSIIGYESVESPNNPNYTRSYGHTLEPTTHTGVLASYQVSELVSLSAGVANTVNPAINSRAHSTPIRIGRPNLGSVDVDVGGDRAESYKTYMGSVAITAPESLGFLAGSTLYGAVVNGFNNSWNDSQTSYYVGSTIATPWNNLRLGAAFDLLDQNVGPGDSFAVAGYASLQATEKMSFHARAEYLRDRAADQKVFGAYPEKVLALTGTLQYDLWRNLISRLEVRWDHALETDNDYYGGEGTGPGFFGLPVGAGAAPEWENAWMVAANLIYKF
jgi:hypothetical protein